MSSPYQELKVQHVSKQAAAVSDAAATIVEHNDWSVLAHGKSGWLEIERAMLRKFQEVYETFWRKQHDYGPANIGIGGMPGVLLRMGDKMARLLELTGLSGSDKDGSATGESVRDALIDMFDYVFIALCVFDGDWPRIDAKDAWGTPGALQKAADSLGVPVAEFKAALEKLGQE